MNLALLNKIKKENEGEIGTIGHPGRNKRLMLGTKRDTDPMCKVFVRNVVVLFLALYGVFKNMELLSFG